MKSIFHNAKVVSENVDPREYHATDIPRGNPAFVMTRSQLCVFAVNPRRWLDGYERKESDSLDWGSLIDAMVLGGFDDRYVVCPAEYTDKDGKQKPWNWNATACKEWRAKHDGKEPLKHSEHLKAAEAVNRLTNADWARNILLNRGTRKQVLITAEYRDPKTGLTIPVKTLLDAVGYEKLIDLKTARSANPNYWAKQAFNNGYHVQAAIGLDLFNAATGEERTDFINIVQENYPPYHVPDVPFLYSQEFLQLGRDYYTTALRNYAQCLKTNCWPSYSHREVIPGHAMIEPEPWMLLQSAETFDFSAAGSDDNAELQPADDLIP